MQIPPRVQAQSSYRNEKCANCSTVNILFLMLKNRVYFVRAVGKREKFSIGINVVVKRNYGYVEPSLTFAKLRLNMFGYGPECTGLQTTKIILLIK